MFPTNRSKSVYSLDSTVARETRSWRRLIHFNPELEIEIGPNPGAPVNRKYLCGDRARGTKTISAYVNHFNGAKSGYPRIETVYAPEKTPYFADNSRVRIATVVRDAERILLAKRTHQKLRCGSVIADRYRAIFHRLF